MIKLLQQFTTKDNIVRNRLLLLKVTCTIIAMLIITGFSTGMVQAAAGIKIYDYTTKKETNYSGKQVKVTLNGTSIGNSKTPGIIIDGYALLSYYDIFEYSNIAAECSYNKDKGTLSISKYGITIKMTLGSKKATVNGKSVQLPVAPRKIKYVKENKVKVMVPSRFVSETLGLGYSWNSNTSTVAIKKNTILLSYNSGEKFEYTGTQGKVTIDGKSVNLGTMPSVITNNTAMLRANKVFAGSAIGAKYNYNKSDKSITFTKDDIVLAMTIGSKTAYLNGVAKKLDTAPMIVKNHETDSSYVMVPGSFTAKSLGFDYYWNSASMTSVISSKIIKEEGQSNPGNTQTDPELGDSGVVNEKGEILAEWYVQDDLFDKNIGVQKIDSGVSAANLGTIYTVSRDYSRNKQNSETYVIVSTAPFSKVSASHSANSITIQADNVLSSDQIYQVYGNLVNTISTGYNAAGLNSFIKLELLKSNYVYDISLSADQLSLYVTVYQNTTVSAVLGKNSAGDYLTLSAISPLEITVSEQANMVTIDLLNAMNGLGVLYSEITGSKYIKYLYTNNLPDRTQIILVMEPGYETYQSENGNSYTISFQTPGGVPTNPDTNSEPEPSVPDVINTGDYEVIIPKPADIKASMITDEDFYLKNYFVIRIPGDYTGMINSQSIKSSSNVIKSISVTLNNKGETEIKIVTSKLQGYKIVSDKSNIYVNIGNPKEIYKNIVVLDPGHGGPANGAQYFGTKEKDINFKILYTIGKKYFNQNPSELKVYYTRTSDVDMTLKDRAAFAQKVGADLFVSLHMNASTISSAKGTEIYYSESNNKKNSAGLNSKTFASYFHDNLTAAMGTQRRGVKSAGYTVVKYNTVPAVLIELGFLSNESDYKIISNEAYQETAAKTIYETILQVFKDYPTGR